MSKYMAAHSSPPHEVRDIFWRKFPVDHPYRDHGWYRLYWGDKELAWLTRSRSTHWDVILQVHVPDMADVHYRGIGFATRWYATEYVLKCVGIWKRDLI